MRKRAVKNPPNANRTVRQITTAALGRRYSMHFQKSSFMDFFSSIMQIRPLKSQAKPSAPAGCTGQVPVSFCRINESFYGLIITYKNKFTSNLFVDFCCAFSAIYRKIRGIYVESIVIFAILLLSKYTEI